VQEHAERLSRDDLQQQLQAVLADGDRSPNGGDYAALDIAGEAVIVVRNKAGALKAFANSCRHRGSQLLTGNGNCNKIK
jgi:choline monooxygenase